jgi:hypothetical protein
MNRGDLDSAYFNSLRRRTLKRAMAPAVSRWHWPEFALIRSLKSATIRAENPTRRGAAIR